MKYRLKVATMAIENKAGRPYAVPIPAGAILHRLGNDGSLERCQWEGREVKLLLHDLNQRCEPINDSAD
jgi:hypothetical protein